MRDDANGVLYATRGCAADEDQTTFAPRYSELTAQALLFRYTPIAVPSRLVRRPSRPADVDPMAPPLDGRPSASPSQRDSCRARRNRDGEPNPVSGPCQRVRGRVRFQRAVADQVAAPDPALRRPVLPLAGVLRGDRDRVLRDSVHRALSEVAVRLQRRRAALDLAGALLRLLGAGHRPLSAIHPRRRARLTGTPGRGLPPAAVPRTRAGEVVAAGHPAPADRVALRRRRALDQQPGDLRQRRARSLGGGCRPGLVAGVFLRDRAAVHRPVPPAAVRLHRGHGPLGRTGGRLRRADDRSVPAVPPGPGGHRPRIGAGAPDPATAGRDAGRRPVRAAATGDRPPRRGGAAPPGGGRPPPPPPPRAGRPAPPPRAPPPRAPPPAGEAGARSTAGTGGGFHGEP